MSMDLYLGGCAQGKLRYVLQKYRDQKAEIADGNAEICRETDRPALEDRSDSCLIWNHFHIYVRSMLQSRLPKNLSDLSLREQEDWEEAFLDLCWGRILDLEGTCRKLLVISDLAGNGIVPLDSGDRIYRDMLGRLQVRLAARADHVELITAGLGQVLKNGAGNDSLDD